MKLLATESEGRLQSKNRKFGSLAEEQSKWAIKICNIILMKQTQMISNDIVCRKSMEKNHGKTWKPYFLGSNFWNLLEINGTPGFNSMGLSENMVPMVDGLCSSSL